MIAETLVKAEHITKEYKSGQGVVKALSDVTIEVLAGETLALVGESGCGKSTLGKVMLQAIKQDKGTVTFDGTDLGSLKKNDLRQMRRRMQMIFQDPYASLDPRMTVRSIIEEPLAAFGFTKKERAERILELSEAVGIPEAFLERYPHQFSGGQRQRVCIARALALKPDFVVCDEPVSALDVSIQAQVLNLLGELQKKMNLTYLFISHDLGVVHHISDRVCVMFLGQICEIGTTDQVFSEAKHPYTQLLLSSTPAIGRKLDPADADREMDEIPSSMNPPSGCRFHTRCPHAMDICKERHPELRGDQGHLCACHLNMGGL